MYISKKELLMTTGISYGQLYRWKRERLIPEEWFMKQSSYTGQETFFPKDKILNRIEFIMKMKDEHSLEEIREMLSYDSSKSKLTNDVLKGFEDIDSNIVQILNRDEYSYIEVLFMIILSKLLIEKDLTINSVEDIIKNTEENIKLLNSTNYSLAIYTFNSKYFGVIYEGKNKILMDKRLEVVVVYNFEDISETFQHKYGKNINEFLGEKNYE